MILDEQKRNAFFGGLFVGCVLGSITGALAMWIYTHTGYASSSMTDSKKETFDAREEARAWLAREPGLV